MEGLDAKVFGIPTTDESGLQVNIDQLRSDPVGHRNCEVLCMVDNPLSPFPVDGIHKVGGWQLFRVFQCRPKADGFQKDSALLHSESTANNGCRPRRSPGAEVVAVVVDGIGQTVLVLHRHHPEIKLAEIPGDGLGFVLDGLNATA